MRFILLSQIVLSLILFPVSAPALVLEDPPPRLWSVMVFGGVKLTGDLALSGDRSFFKSELRDSYIVGLAINREMFTFQRHFDFELEGQVVRHIGIQQHWEFNGLFVVRFNTFPWDKYLDTSFAVGEGVSHTTTTPKMEKLEPNQEFRLLNYFLYELAVSLPRYPEWALIVRNHHRSGVFGLFTKHNVGSNFGVLGFRYHF